MFTIKQLQVIAEMCETETSFLQHVERRGLPAARQLAVVAAVRATAIEAAENLAKAEAVKAPEKKG